MTPATIQPVNDVSSLQPKQEIRAASIVLAVDNTASSSPSSKGTVKTSTPPRINPEKAGPVFFNGQDPNALMAQILKMMQAVQEVEAAIAQAMASNSKYQQQMASEFLTVVVATGNQMIEKMRQAEEAAEEAKQDSNTSWILGAVVGFFCALATAVTFGATAGLFALAFAVVMALPPEDNPIEKGANALSNAMGGGTLGDIFGKLTMIAILVAGVCAGGAGVGMFAEEGAEMAADEAVEDGAEEAVDQGKSSFTKQAVSSTTRSLMVDTGVQTTLMLNPLSDVFAAIAKATGHENDAIGTLLQVVAAIITVVLAVIAMKYGKPDMAEDSGLLGLSKQNATLISKWSARLAAAAAVASASFDIAAGVAKQNQATFLKEEAALNRIYTTIQALIKMLQSSIQQNSKQQQTTTETFQTIAGNFAHLADPFKFLAQTSEVLA